MDFWNWFGGLIRLRVTSADVSGSLSVISQSGLAVFNCEILDEMNAVFTVKQITYKRLNRILTGRGDSIEILGKQGFFWQINQLGKRPVLTVGILILLLLNIYLPGRIFFIQVEGNSSVPTRKILEEAGKNGLYFGTSRREIRSEKLKNALLEAIPQLQWSGVNTSGCVAIISVRERQSVQLQMPEYGVSSIVAARDGIVLNCTVTRGNPICKVGQAVKAGEVLISGYTDCGLMIQATKAEGEVYAKTEREVSLIYPRIWQKKSIADEEITKYSLIIGKKRINLYNGSGISDTTCGKMYEEWFLTLPGNFVLPVGIARETWNECVVSEAVYDAEEAKRILSVCSKAYLSEQMIAGQIMSSNEVFSEQEFAYQTEGKYACTEMIGQVRKEDVYGNYK